MRRLEVALLFLVALQSCAALAAEPIALRFDTYSGYFVSNEFEPNAPQSFVVITDQEHFDKAFGVAMVMDDKSHRLPSDAFRSKMVVAAIRRGSAVWNFKVEDVTVTDGVVQLQYTSKAKRSATVTLTYACPLIVSIPKDEYKAVEFIENKKSAKKIELEQKVKSVRNRPTEPMIPPPPIELN